MIRKLLTITGISITVILLLIFISGLLFRIYSPQYFIPYVIDQVQKETNGRYTLAINSDSVKVRLLTMNLDLGHTEFKRDSLVDENSGIDFLDKFDAHVQFESLHISALQVLKFVVNKRIRVEEIILDKPAILITKNIHYRPDEITKENSDGIPPTVIDYDADSVLADTLAWKEFHESRAAIKPYIRVDTFRIDDASFAFYDGRKSYPVQEVHGLDFNLLGFVSDEHDDIEMEDASVHIDSVSSLVSKNLARLTVKGIDVHPDSVHIDDFYFSHIVDRYRINRIKGFRASWLNVHVNDIDIDGIHPGRLVSDSILNIDKASIGYVSLYLFKDKEELIINPAHKALPPEQIRQIPIPILVDTIEIKSGDFIIDMEAPKAIAPGRITLNQFHAQILNLTNDKKALKENQIMALQAEYALMDSAKVNLDAEFQIDSPDDKFKVNCQVAPFNVSILNGFLGSQFFIEFPRGDIENMSFQFEGNNKANVGTMDFEYSNLKVTKLKNYEQYIDGKPSTGFITTIGNMLIPNNRSSQAKNYKQAVIYYEKEYNRDFIHGTIMSLVSGVTSSMGFSSKNLEKKENKASQLDDTATLQSAEEVQKKADKASKKGKDSGDNKL